MLVFELQARQKAHNYRSFNVSKACVKVLFNILIKVMIQAGFLAWHEHK